MSDTQPLDDATGFEEGRYLYCAVRTNGGHAFDADGIENADVSVLRVGDIGILQHPVDSLYDSDRVAQIRQWLLAHQEVVDAAGETFGTPLPFRFDTILTGDEATVSDWVDAHREELADALSWLSGRWEYRVDLDWDREAIREDIVATDPELAGLAEEVEDAGAGTAHLLERQFEQEVATRLDERRVALAEDVHAAIAPIAVRVERTGPEPGLFEEETGLVRLSVLAERQDEDAIGDALEDFDRGNYDVRYTGPWPPYTFAPSIGEDDDQ